ncbi:MAG: hypothetical protein KGL63_03205, partial [Betaproteobacteria bacterium]|nr:hypothetical protein [Betaproteobacteria bacterium]
MPFSNSTIRQRWLKGQVVPEYKVIMLRFSLRGVGKSVNVFPVLFLEGPGDHKSDRQENHD